MKRTSFVAAGLCLACVALAVHAPPARAQKKRPGPRHEAMEYGPYLTASIGAPFPKNNVAMKGLAIRLGAKKDAAVCFDTDLVRFSAGWTGEYLNLRGTPFDGSHGSWPTVKGKQQWGSRPAPGWARPGTDDFKDARSEPFGPLPRTWARYKGLYLHGDKVVLRYTVGVTSVLELPAVEQKDGLTAFTRTLNLAPSKEGLTAVVADVEKAPGRTAEGVAVLEGPTLTVAGLVNAPAGATFRVADGRILLQLPASKEPVKLKVVIGNVAKGDLNKFRAFLGKSATSLDLAPLTRGGPPRWTKPVTTKGALGKGTGAYVVDTITTPEDNPYHSWMRFGGFDFFSDGRAALCTWSGDVWIVSGLDDKLDKLTWKRFATGLFQPLGLKIVDDKVYVLGREGIVRLHDLNGDGEADFYEAFNNDVHTTTGFHEFAFDLQTDPEGNFYYAKAGPVRGGGRGFDYIAAHSGCILKVSKDGSKHEVFATGFRAPNGIGVGPRGEVTSGDNEGTWTPMCRLSLVLPGSFNGCVDTAHRAEPPTWFDMPICWFPKNVDNSSGGQCWVTSTKWGPLTGHLLHTAYGTSSLYHVLMQRDGNRVQGGVVKMPVNFLTGAMRPRFNKLDGQLYVCGLRGWQTNAARDAAFQRVRYTGKPFHTVHSMKVVKGGLELAFTEKLDPRTAGDVENYTAQQWNYLWCSEYGSADYSTTTPGFDAKVREYNRLRAEKKRNQAAIQAVFKELKRGKDRVEVRSAKLSADGKTVTLAIPNIKPVMQMHLRFRIKAADGSAIAQEIYSTINYVP